MMVAHVVYPAIDDVPAGYYTVPFGLPEVKRPGNDVTILTVGSTLYRAVEAAARLGLALLLGLLLFRMAITKSRSGEPM